MPPYVPRTVLVTGGAGFIGCNFVRHLLTSDRNLRIVNLDKLTYAGSLDNLASLHHADRHIFVQGDICDRSLVDRLLREHDIDTVVHFAAESHVDRSITGPAAFVETNVCGTFTLLEATRQLWLDQRGWGADACRFHHVSTDEVYGTLAPTDPAFSELTPYAPNSPYSASKAASDHLVRAYFHTYALPVTTTNCSNNYGAYQHQEKFIPTIIRSCAQGQAIPVYGDGSNIRDWLYVDDHCSGVERVMRAGELGEVYNIGGCNEWRNIDIVRHICRLMDERLPAAAPHENLIRFVTDRPGHDWRYAIDAGKMRDRLAWTPSVSFEQGIAQTCDWYLARL